MVSTLLENFLVKTDTLIERVFRPPGDREPVSFGRHLANPERILLVGEEDLAGACAAAGFIPALQDKFPRAELGVVLRPEQAGLLDGLERVKVYPWSRRSSHQFDSEFRRLSAELREADYHWGINLSAGGRAEALLIHAAGVIVRTGLAGDENERYYNLVVKGSADNGRLSRYSHLLRTLRIDVPPGAPPLPVRLSDEDRRRADRFIRQRRNSRSSGRFIGFAPESPPGERGLERLLQGVCARLAAEYDPLRMLIAGNLVAGDELKKNDNLRAHLYYFDNLRRMAAAMSCCDRVITDSAGMAWLLGEMDVSVGVIGRGVDRMAELGLTPADSVTVLAPAADGPGPEELALEFTR